MQFSLDQSVEWCLTDVATWVHRQTDGQTDKYRNTHSHVLMNVVQWSCWQTLASMAAVISSTSTTPMSAPLCSNLLTTCTINIISHNRHSPLWLITSLTLYLERLINKIKIKTHQFKSHYKGDLKRQKYHFARCTLYLINADEWKLSCFFL